QNPIASALAPIPAAQESSYVSIVERIQITAAFKISMLRGIRTAHNLPSAQSTTLFIALIPQQEVTGYGHHSLGTIPADQPIFVGKELASISIQSGAGSEHHRGLRALARRFLVILFTPLGRS